jgi:hypothetical protein
MDDRELLEMAAKAAWYQVDTGFADCPLIFGEDAGHDGPREWNPLEDDGDALRLAVKLKLIVEVGSCWLSKYGPVFGEDVLPDPLSATRRAIVRAAAQIGRAM